MLHPRRHGDESGPRLTRTGIAAGLLALLVWPGSVQASALIARNATHVRLAVSKQGTALVTFRSNGSARRVEAWGAVNALAPTPTRPQVRFQLHYGSRRVLANECARYDGPALPWLVTACRASDGSYWALQSWQRMLPNNGVAPTARQAVWELHLSHWNGPLAELTVLPDWIYAGRFHGLFGRLTYRGNPVFGFKATRMGVPLDAYGRNLYLDTYNSAYGRGWRRENSFLAHGGSGLFCYGFFPFPAPGRAIPVTGEGERYRITVIGPGVTPDIRWQGEGLPDFDGSDPELVAREEQTNRVRAAMLANDSKCRKS